MKKIIFILLFFFVAGVGAGIYYLDTYYLPRVARQKIVAELSRITGGEVTLDSVSVSLWRGLVLSGLTLFDKDEPARKLAAVDEISSFVLFWASLKDKAVILPVIRIKGASLYLKSTPEEKINVAPLMEKMRKPPAAQRAFAILVKTVSIEDTEIFFSDQLRPTAVETTAAIDHLAAKITGAGADFEGVAELVKNDQRAVFTVTGRFESNGPSLTLSAAGKHMPWTFVAPYLDLLPATIKEARFDDFRVEVESGPKDLRLSGACHVGSLKAQKDALGIQDGILQASASLTFAKETPSAIKLQVRLDGESGRVSWGGNTPAQAELLGSTIEIDKTSEGTQLKIRLALANARAQKDLISMRADIDPAEFTVRFPAAPSETQGPEYQGVITVKKGAIEGLPKIGTVTDIDSTIAIDNGAITMKDATAKILETPVTSTGSYIQNILLLDLAGNFESQKLKGLLPLSSPVALDLSGPTRLKLHLSFDPSKGTTPAFSGELTLSEDTVTLALPQKNLAFACSKGRIKFDTREQTVLWHFEDLLYRDASYDFSGNLAGFKVPRINALLIGKDLRVQADFMKKEEELDFTFLKGSFRDSLFNLTGTVNAGRSFDLQGTVKLDCKDLRAVPAWNDALSKASPEGGLFLAGHVSGPFEKHALWKATVKGHSEELKLYGLRFSDVTLDYLQTNQRGFINSLEFWAYGGKGAVKGRFDLSGDDIPYAFQGLLEEIDLARLRTDTAMKDSKLAGQMDLKFSLKGQGTDLSNMKGYGSVLIKNGNLLQFNPLKGLGNFIFIPKFASLNFSQAQGDFAVDNGAIMTDNLELIGDQLGLLLEGKITWAGELDFVVNTQVLASGKKESIEEEAREEKLKEFVNATGGLTAIQVTGTVDKPQYKLLPVGKNIVKKIGDVISAVVPVDVGL